ncbi:MAG: hypothetical protein JSV46_00540 [Candidatus Aminicenantes bacterium]|nr:MAG: hypothetical protein JSV46_00540 [Candidatus Aminicenantes bacterium]
MKDKILRLNLYIGIFILIGSASLLALQVSFFKTWFFSFAWWSFILIMDSVNYRKSGASLLSESPRNFLFTAFISVFVWLIFELFNLRLKNWSYHNLPESVVLRWLGYFIAFATVVPAMREIALFMEGLFKKSKLALFRLRATPLLLRIFFISGIIFFFLFIVWPRLFFPFAWLCFIFLLEPVNIWLGNDSLWKDVEKRDWTRFWSWVSAGLAAGFLWEFWNFWAASRWEYSLPYLNFWRIFQMPVFGYTGFLPFALEIFAIYQILLYLNKKMQSRILLKVMVAILLLVAYGGIFYLIDTYTLK